MQDEGLKGCGLWGWAATGLRPPPSAPFQDDFVGGEGVCSSLLDCFAFGLLNGLRAGGGLGDLLPGNRGRAVFDFAFFLVIVVIILNIVFGIIIDTFAELRDEKQFIEKDNKKSCLICGQSANLLDRYIPGGFSVHVRQSHNMWQASSPPFQSILSTPFFSAFSLPRPPNARRACDASQRLKGRGRRQGMARSPLSPPNAQCGARPAFAEHLASIASALPPLFVLRRPISSSLPRPYLLQKVFWLLVQCNSIFSPPRRTGTVHPGAEVPSARTWLPQRHA